MITFGFKDFEMDIPDWSKHHKTIGLHVKRVNKETGEEILTKDETLKAIIQENSSMLKENAVKVIGKNTNETINAVDYYLPIENREYQEATIEYYTVGSMNTKQTTYIRFTFLIENNKFILDYQYKSEGRFARNFTDLLSGNNIKDVIDEVLKQRLPIEKVGIIPGENNNYIILTVAPHGEIVDIEVDKQDLFNNLIGVEIYRFKQEIISPS